MRSALIAVSVAALYLAAPIQAQQVRGVIRDSLSQAPLSGAVIAVVDSSGATGARTIADASGRFTLALGRAAMRLHAIRIGYQPRDVPLTLTKADSLIAFTMTRIPVLDVVKVAAAELCPGSTDRGAAFQLWEQARAGLLASVVAREAKPATVTSLTFRRSVWPSDGLVHDGVTETRNGRTTKPFIATAPPATFAAVGYVAEYHDGSRTYSAPDADVLLDQSFVETHCFHLERADRAHPDQIGLAFTPVSGRDTVVDVTGVIWMDRTTPALRTLEFRYTGLEPAAEKANMGGHVEFRTMTNGVAFIDYWTLRLPEMTEPTMASSLSMPIVVRRSSSVPGPRRRQDRIELRLTDVREAGGMVTEATWDDGTHWTAPRTALMGTVIQKGSAAPVPYAVVTLLGTSDTATADAMGRFTLSPIISGRYNIVAVDTSLRGYAPERSQTKTVDVTRGQTTTIRAELTPLGSVLANVCKDQPSSPNTVTLLGHLARGSVSPSAARTIAATWLASVTKSGDDISGTTRDQASTIDASGRFVVCGVAPDALVRLKLLDGRLVVADTSVYTARDAITRFEWKRPE